MNKLYYKYWGKAKKLENGTYDYHLLPYHCLDVAAVGWLLMSPKSRTCIDIAQYLSLEPKTIQYLFTLTLLLHDVGKFSNTFQGQILEIFNKFRSGRNAGSYDERHDTLGFLLWRGDCKNDARSIQFIVSQYNSSLAKLLELIIRPGTGHHGIPPKESMNNGAAILRAAPFFGQEDYEASKQYVYDCLEILEPLTHIPENIKKLKKTVHRISWEFAGLSIISDWIGSSSENFKYCKEKLKLGEYWEKRALPQAESALRKVKWKSIQSNKNFNGISSFFPFITSPTPLQNLAERISLPKGPKLIIIEDVTGAGKTETAITLAARIMAAGEADGLYIGLPTMATANAMYNRMRGVYKKLFRDTELPSLILAHGARHLSPNFNETIAIHPQNDDQPYEHEFSSYCDLWYTDNRKKALLADIGVGTIDQALVGVLPARHQSLRLLGLKRKILIIDEVHAYDPYMEHLLEVLLEAHARSGGSLILLSATIPLKKRIDFIKAFNSGLDIDLNASEIEIKEDFPLLTQVGHDTFMEVKVDTKETVKRFTSVDYLHSYKNVLLNIHEKAKSGKCVCWIRNTVKDARKAFHDLIKTGIEPSKITLFHSRFAMIDRVRIENSTIKNFGKESGEEERTGRILISTQVVEQSLDLDFDYLISDIAPIDLLIQRAGRLHRHIRDCNGNVKNGADAKDDREKPVFTVFCPEFTSDADSTWLSGEFSGTLAVYQNAGVLWRTMEKLNSVQGWDMPEDARILIESVYGPGCYYECPDGLINNVCNADGKDKSKKQMGHLNALMLEKGYCRNAVKAAQWEEDVKAPTRLTEENTEIALAVFANDTLIPYAKSERYPWDWSCLSISAKDWKNCNYAPPSKFLGLIEELKNKYKRLKFTEIVVVKYCSDNAFALKENVSEYYNQHLGWGLAIKEEGK